jgi:hypothetical protein
MLILAEIHLVDIKYPTLSSASLGIIGRSGSFTIL